MGGHHMTTISPLQLAEKLGLEILSAGEGADRTIQGIYCCDLLSIVMGRAKNNDAWITVMSNINVIACGVLADVSCIIISENIPVEEEVIQKAKTQNVCLLHSELPTFELSAKIAELLQ